MRISENPNTEDIIPRIIEDFDFAKKNLPGTQDQVGRATKWAAQAYLGKVKLYTGDFNGRQSGV